MTIRDEARKAAKEQFASLQNPNSYASGQMKRAYGIQRKRNG